MNWKCFFKGHTHSLDTSYKYFKVNNEVCDRCGKHDYFDSIHADPGCLYVKSIFHSYEFTLPTMLSIPRIWLRHKLSLMFKRCQDCKKIEYILGKQVGEHKDCLPF